MRFDRYEDELVRLLEALYKDTIAPFTRYNLLSNRLSNRIDNRLYIVYTNIQPVVKPV